MDSSRIPGNRIFFCTFADSRMWRSLQRIERQAKEMAYFDKILAYNEFDLNKDFRQKHEEILNFNTNGFGYWIWKPQVILQTLDEMAWGDSLLYLDAGSHLNKKGLLALEEYFEKVKESDAGILVTRLGKNLIERKWTKGDVFTYFGCSKDIEITDTPQFQAGCVFINKRRETYKLIKRWKEAAEIYNLIDDSPSNIEIFSDFISHRHDQSIFSVLCKMYKVETIPATKFWTRGDWRELKDQPIWLKRDKQFNGNLNIKTIRRLTSRLFKMIKYNLRRIKTILKKYLA